MEICLEKKLLGTPIFGVDTCFFNLNSCKNNQRGQRTSKELRGTVLLESSLVHFHDGCQELLTSQGNFECTHLENPKGTQCS